MKYTRESFIQKIGLKNPPDAFGTDFEYDFEQFEKSGTYFLEESFLDEVQQKYGFFPTKFDFVKKSAKLIRENETASLYAYLLERMLARRERNTYCKLFETKITQDEEYDLALEMAPFFALTAHFPKAIDNLRKKQVPEDMISRSVLHALEGAILASSSSFGRDGFNISTYFSWNQRHLDNKLLTVGVLNFEMRDKFTDTVAVLRNKAGDIKYLAKNVEISTEGYYIGTEGQTDVAYFADYVETDGYYEGYPVDSETCKVIPDKARFCKDEWYTALTATDSVINVHIPKNADITPENCEASYRKVLEIFGRLFPDFVPKAFMCSSWMIDPQLKGMLKPDSKILSFQSKYTKFAQKATGLGVLKFVFNKPSGVKVNYEELDESTSLQRILKKHYIDGKYIYAQGGLFFLDQIER